MAWSLYEMFMHLRWHLISKACVLFSNSAVKVHDRHMDMTRERISFDFDPREMLLSLYNGFSFVTAAVACTIIERSSGFEPSSETMAPMYLQLVTVLSFCPVTLISLWMPLTLYVLSLVSNYLHFIPCISLVETFNQGF